MVWGNLIPRGRFASRRCQRHDGMGKGGSRTAPAKFRPSVDANAAVDSVHPAGKMGACDNANDFMRGHMAAKTNSGLTLVETWQVSNRVNLRLLDALTDDQLATIIQPRGKPVTSYFAHIHMARYYWLERRAPALAKGLMKVPAGSATRATLRKALTASSEAMANLFMEAERTGQIKGTKIGPLGFLGYALTHEGHHRGQILLHLKLAKKPVNRDVTYSLWYWNKI